jgi:biotin transport system substrate-specific component
LQVLATVLQRTIVRTVWHRVATIIAFTLFITICSQIAVPLTPVPFTLQTLAILMIGALSSPRLAAETVATYLGLAALGCPLLAGFSGGLLVFCGPTGGYLIGFFCAAVLIAWLFNKGFKRLFIGRLFAMSVGLVVIYIFGLLWLVQFVGWEHLFWVGVMPFLVGELLKITVVCLLTSKV